MGLFGLNLGFKKDKSSTNSTSTLDKNEAINQSQTTGTTSSQNTTQTGTQSSQSTGTSNTSSTQTGTQTGVGTKTSDLAGTTSLFSQGTLAGLEDLVSGLMTRVGETSGAKFDAEKYLDGITTSAAAKSQTELDAALGGIGDMVGSKIGNNSAATLLAQRVRSDAAAGQAGIASQAAGTAAQIGTAQAGQENDLLAQLLGTLKGGVSTTTQTGSEGTTQSGTTSSTGNQSTATSESTNQASQTATAQTIQQLVEALLTGTTTTNASETSASKTKGSSLSGSISAGK